MYILCECYTIKKAQKHYGFVGNECSVFRIVKILTFQYNNIIPD